MKKYNPSYVKPKDWNEIRDWYSELIHDGLQLKPMLDLVEHIIKNKFKNRLFATTSRHTLILSIYDEIDLQTEVLKIEFNLSTRNWLFDYYGKPFEDAQFSRQYDENLGIEKFDQFIKFIKW